LAWGSDIGRFRGRIGYTIRVLEAATGDKPAQVVIGPDAHVPGPPPNGPAYSGKHNYMEALAPFLFSSQLSQSEKELILGQTTRRLLKWPGTKG